MIFVEAIRALKNDSLRSFFFLLTFVLTSMFIFLFFALSCAIGEQPIITGITVLSIFICSMDIFSANSFFVHAKAKDMAVRLICGATYSFLASYLLIQTVILLLIAIPIGIGLAYVVLPVISSVMNMAIVITSEALLRTGTMLGYILFWIVLLNLSFAYKSAASMMLNGQGQLVHGGSNVFYVGAMPKQMMTILYAILYVGPIILMFVSDLPVAMDVIIAMVAIYGVITKVYVNHLNQKIYDKQIQHSKSLISLGFVRDDFRQLKWNILLLVGSALLLFSFSSMVEMGSLEYVLIFISYVMLSMLLGLAIMFKYATVQSGRTRYVRTLMNLGYVQEDIDKILRGEVRHLYMLLMVIGGIYIIALLAYQAKVGVLTTSAIIIGCVGYFGPLLICYVISIFYYRTIHTS